MSDTFITQGAEWPGRAPLSHTLLFSQGRGLPLVTQWLPWGLGTVGSSKHKTEKSLLEESQRQSTVSEQRRFSF